jgi:hypothetical protein
MKSGFLDRRRVRQALTVLLVTGAVTCLFPPDIPVFRWWSEQVMYIALGYLALGLLFLTLGKIRLMFVCFGCSAAISLYEIEIASKQSTSTGNQRPERFEVSHSSVPYPPPVPVYEF